jgi:hypothetical protein
MIQASPLKFVSPSALPKYVNFGLGGVAGAGKTHLLGTVGKGNKVLIFDTEGGNVTFNSASFLSDPAATELENIHIVTFEDVTTTAELAHRVEGALDYLIRTKNSDGYSLVALDSLTEFQARFLSLDNAADKRQSYGRLQEALYAIVHKARQAPVHTVFTARLRHTQDDVLGREVVRFDVSPGVWSIISGLFDNIGFLDLRAQGVRTTRILDFSHKIRTQGKDRFGLGELTDPKFSDIMSKLAGEAPSAKAEVPVRR